MTVSDTTEWVYINDIIHPPYKQDVILLTSNGVIAGYLKETNEYGHKWVFYSQKNDFYYQSSKVLAYIPYPKAPKTNEKISE